jgi:hypothetical protein
MSEITLAELEQKLNRVKYFTGFSVYRGKSAFEITVYRNRRVRLTSGLRDDLIEAIESIYEKERADGGLWD